MLLAILAFYWGYKKAKATGRNAALWSVICGVTFIGIQLLIGFGIGFLIAIGTQFWGWDEKMLDQYSILITIVSFVPAIVTLVLIFRYLDKIPDDGVQSVPPPPPTFNPPT
jgi:hypothetical protein